MIVAAVLRFAGLGAQSYWYDESFTVHLVHRPLGGLLSGVARTESTPPLYYGLAWVWAHLFGSGEVALRSLSALAGIALVPVTYAIGVAAGSRRAGWAGAALVAVNPLAVWMSQEARAYALLALMCALSLLAWVRALRSPGRRPLVLWAVASALALTVHYFAAFPIVVEAVWLLIRRRDERRATWAAVAGVGAVALALVPLAAHQRASNAAAAVEGTDLAHRAGGVPKELLLGAYASQVDAAWVVLPAAALALLAVGLVVSQRRREAPGVRVLGVLAVASVAVPLVLAVGGLDYVNPRNLLPVLVPLALVVGGALTAVRPTALGAVVLAGLCVLGVAMDVAVTRDGRLQRDDWRTMAVTVRTGSRAGPALVVLEPAGGEPPLSLYLTPTLSLRGGGAGVRTLWAMVLTRPARPLPVLRTPPGFTGTSTWRTGSYVLRRYTAPAPVRLSPAAARRATFPGSLTSVLLWRR